MEKKTKQDTNFDLCIICQQGKEGEALVENPSSHEKLIAAVQERSTYGDSKYSEIWSSMKLFSMQELSQASRHRTCYQDATHSSKLKRAKAKYERELTGTDVSKRKSARMNEQQSGSQLTRSKTTPYNKDLCFFCEGVAGYHDPLHIVSTMSAGQSLHNAIQASGDEKLRVKLSTAVDVTDAHAIDIRYHKNCWSKNVSNVLRKPFPETSSTSTTMAAETAAKIEFLNTTESSLRNRNILNMSDLHALYDCILEENCIVNQSCIRKTLEQLLQNEIQGIEFHKPKRVNEAERVTIKETRDVAVQLSEDVADLRDNMKTLYDAALLLRKSINKSKKWVFDGSFENLTNENYPKELYCFFRWVINGPRTCSSEDAKGDEVHRRTMNLVQSTMFMCLTQRQTDNKKAQVVKASREMPQQLAVGLAIHQSTSSKELVNLLHGFGMSVEYNRLLRVEAQIESAVLDRMEKNDGIFLPPEIVKGRHVFFAVDNVDFAEDTYDGKNTLHGTAIAIYQKCQQNDEKPDTDVFILTLRRYPELCENNNFVTGTGQRHRVIKLNPIVNALGMPKILALPALHALSGCDNTGSFAGKGKTSWWKAFQRLDQEVLTALIDLGTSEILASHTTDVLEKLICQLYVPNTTITSVRELRWLLFRKKQAESEKLPPTQAALHEALKRANYQAIVWRNDLDPNPRLPSPQNFGWKLEDEEWPPIMTSQLPAPSAIIHLVKCGCVKDCCSTSRCQCQKARLGCTDLWGCADGDDECRNTFNEDSFDYDENDDDEDDDDDD